MWACVKTSNCGHLVLTSHYIVDAYGFSSPNREFFCLGSWSTCGCLITWTSEHTWTTNATSPSLHPHRVILHVEITGKAHTYRKSGFPSPPRLPPKQRKNNNTWPKPAILPTNLRRPAACRFDPWTLALHCQTAKARHGWTPKAPDRGAKERNLCGKSYCRRSPNIIFVILVCG